MKNLCIFKALAAFIRSANSANATRSDRDWLEKLRWPEGPICSYCGTVNRAYKTKREGWYRCAEKKCRKDFSVATGPVTERSHIPLNKWLMAFYLLNASKKGISAHQPTPPRAEEKPRAPQAVPLLGVRNAPRLVE